MKREVSFFRDRRSSTFRALVETMRAVGMPDEEIRAELLRLQALREVERVKRQLAAEAPAPVAPDHGLTGVELGAPADPAQSGQGAVSCNPTYTGKRAS